MPPSLRWDGLSTSGVHMNTVTNVASTALAYGVVLYAAHRVFKSCLVRLDKSKQQDFFVERIWKIVTQGYTSAGLVSQDLGEPDEEGVYTYTSTTGQLYFRMVRDPHGLERWEFSKDRVFWIPTAYADSLWFSPEESPSLADKVIIQRLEVEAELRRARRVTGCSSVPQPPALDLSMAEKDLSGLQDSPLLPREFLCPISLQLMTDPVITPAGITYNSLQLMTDLVIPPAGITYKRSALDKWIVEHQTDPATGQHLRQDQLYSNLTVRDMIQKWLVEPDLKAGPHSSGPEAELAGGA